MPCQSARSAASSARRSSCRLSVSELQEQVFKLPDQIDERDAEDATDLAQFQQVQAAYAGFIIADEGLRLSQCARHIDLAETGIGPKLAEQR